MDSPEMWTIVATQAIVTCFALAVGYVKLRQEIGGAFRREVQARQLERLECQLSEFYGPLHMLTTAARSITDIAWGTDIWNDVFKEVLLPQQFEAERILLTKIHLLDEADIPKSYFDFLAHVRLVRCYRDDGLDISYFEKQTPYPRQFDADIAAAYGAKRRDYLQVFARRS